MASPQWLIVGLGNPGREYAGHRHNVGFMAVDAVTRRYGFGSWRERFCGEVSEGRVGDGTVTALKPMTFMNESGRAVGLAARFYKLSPARVVVFHDELDVAAGKVRVKRGGGAAGHNGLRSIDSHLGRDYWRVRIGIGHPGDKSQVLGHVLKEFTVADHAWLDPLLSAMADNISRLLEGNVSGFMNKMSLDSEATQASTQQMERKSLDGERSGGV